MEYIKNPREIEAKSMDIIDSLIGKLDVNKEEEAVIKRIIHTTGDPDYVKHIKIHPEATVAGLEALKRGAKVFTDVNMVLTGINKNKLAELGCEINCAINHPDVVATAKKTGKTRALTAIDFFADQMEGSIVVIGNAPTALFQTLKLVDQGICPSLIVGIPVGFVGAAESKELLTQYDVPYITVEGFKGGSGVAAASVNALLYQL